MATSGVIYQDMKYKYIVTIKRVRVTIVAVEKKW